MNQLPTVIAGPGSVRLPDGRLLTFVSAGPEDGFPVVYCHGAIGSPRWRTPGLDSVLEQLAVRYLVVNRPGFGGSDPSPGRTVVDHSRDIGELMNALGHLRFSVVGVSAGAPYALACGLVLAERIEALAAVSPLGPPSGGGASPSWRYRVPLVPFGSRWLGPPLAHVCLRGLRLHRQTSARAMIADYLVCRGEWGFDPAELQIPVAVWHGRADRLVPLSHALALAGAIATCTARVDRNGGHFFYSRRIDKIIGSLVPQDEGAITVEMPALRSAA
jgi:pimeloyl-ACP methyl ester carboxylesterase